MLFFFFFSNDDDDDNLAGETSARFGGRFFARKSDECAGEENE